MRLILPLILSLTLAGCADAAQQPAEPSSAEASEGQSAQLDLTGTRWESTSATGIELPAGSAVTLDFSAGGQVDAHIACNFLGVEAEIEDGRLVAGNFSTTDAGCDPDAHAADQWLADLLESRPEISRDGDTLTLTGDESSVVLALASDGIDQTRPDQSDPQAPAETANPDETVAFAEVDVVADEPTMPDEEQMAPVGLVTAAEAQQAQWDRFRLTAPAPSFDFTDQVLLFLGFGESGSCPRIYEGLEITGHTVALVDANDPEQVCTGDFNPRTLVLAVPRGLLPDGFVTVVSSGPAAVISVEPNAEPPPAVPTSMGAITDVELLADPESAPVGSDVSVHLANNSEGDQVGGAPYLIVERWTGHHFEATGSVGGIDPPVEVGPAEDADLMTLSTADLAFTGAGWFRLTTQLSVTIDGVASGSMDVRANLHLTDESSAATPLTITSGPPCPADSSCASSVFIDGVSYQQSCGLIDPAWVTEEVYASGEGETVNVIRDVDPRIMVAWDYESCGPPMEGRWHLMYATDVRGSAEEEEAWCRVALNGPDPAEGFSC